MRVDGRSGCPINMTVEAFGDRWSLLIIRDIMFGNRRHFRELLAGSQEGIASNILADRLKRLGAAGLLTRDDARPGQRATYSLTEPAIQLVPVFAELGAWGVRHRSTTPKLRARAELLAEGGREMWEQYMLELREMHLGAPVGDPGRPSVRERLARALAGAAPDEPAAARHPASESGQELELVQDIPPRPETSPLPGEANKVEVGRP
jgi:DNA-binding HxlR family transcriptional regulator